jgi:hypothetical protein
MVGKKRTYRPYSKDKVKVTIYNTITARMGVFGTESLLLQVTALSYSEQAANSWDEYGNLAAKLYRTLQAELGTTGVRAAGLRALVGAAIKFIKEAKYGRLYNRNEIRDRLEEVANKVGLDPDTASRAIDMLLNQIPSAAQGTI